MSFVSSRDLGFTSQQFSKKSTTLITKGIAGRATLATQTVRM